MHVHRATALGAVHLDDALVVVEGEPATALLGFARAHDNDLLALGTHGRTGLRRALLGSVAETVLRDAPADVLVARLPAA